MNRQEAILQLQAARLMLLGNDNQPVSDLYYAIDVAITALEQVPTYRKKAKRWKRKYFALKTEIEKMKAEIQNMPKTYPHTDHFDDYVKTEDVLRIINKHIGKEQR